MDDPRDPRDPYGEDDPQRSSREPAGPASDPGSDERGPGGPSAPDDGWDDPDGQGRSGSAPAMSRTLAIGVGLVLAAVAAVAALVSLQADDEPDSAGAGLPLAVLEGFDGAPRVDLADLVGAPLVVNFWATWCAPCVAEMPDLQRLHEAAGGQLTLLGIDTRDSPVNATAFVEELGITYDLAVDSDGAYFQEVGGFGMPTTLFVDSDGRVAWRHTGPLTLEQMHDLVAEHLGVRARG